MKSVDTLLMGRETYEAGLRLGGTFDPKRKTYVFSHKEPPANVPRGVEFVSGGVSEFVRRLRERNGKDIWLMGGGELIASAGVTHRQELRPIHFTQRTSTTDVRSFAQLYPALRPGELLEGTQDPRFRDAWRMAQAETFQPAL